MAVQERDRRLMWHGVLIVLLGLCSGALIPLVTNPRMGLAAHLTGVLNGMLLVVLGLAWKHATLRPRLEQWSFGLLLYSMYVVWGATLLGAILGTGRLTPIAAQGHQGAGWQEAVVSLGLGTGALAVFVALLLFFTGLGRRATPAP